MELEGRIVVGGSSSAPKMMLVDWPAEKELSVHMVSWSRADKDHARESRISRKAWEWRKPLGEIRVRLYLAMGRVSFLFLQSPFQ